MVNLELPLQLNWKASNWNEKHDQSHVFLISFELKLSMGDGLNHPTVFVST